MTETSDIINMLEGCRFCGQGLLTCPRIMGVMPQSWGPAD